MGEGIVRESGMDRYTLLYLKWVTEGPTVRPTVQHRNPAQCYVAAWMGGSLRENGYTYMYA